jgi:hypothetical protein
MIGRFNANHSNFCHTKNCMGPLLALLHSLNKFDFACTKSKKMFVMQYKRFNRWYLWDNGQLYTINTANGNFIRRDNKSISVIHGIITICDGVRGAYQLVGREPSDWALVLGLYHEINGGCTDPYLLGDLQDFLQGLANLFVKVPQS